MSDKPVIRAEDMECLRHMLGIRPTTAKALWGRRNFFDASETDRPKLERLREAGLVVFVAPPSELYGGYNYRATLSGAMAAGLTAAGIRRCPGLNQKGSK